MTDYFSEAIKAIRCGDAALFDKIVATAERQHPLVCVSTPTGACQTIIHPTNEERN